MMKKTLQRLGLARKPAVFDTPAPKFVPGPAPTESPAAPAKPAPKRYVSVDAEGVPTAFYSDDVHSPEQIPADATPLTDEQYRTFHRHGGLMCHRLHRGEVVERRATEDTAEREETK